MPHCAAEQDTVQVTPELLVSFATVAVTGAVELVGTVAVLGDTDTAIAGGGEEEVDEPPPQPEVAPTTTVASTSTNLKRYLKVIRTPLSIRYCVLPERASARSFRNPSRGDRSVGAGTDRAPPRRKSSPVVIHLAVAEVVGDALNKVAADPEVEVAMFEILEIQKIVESKARIILIPEKGGILPELLASTSRSPESSVPSRTIGKAAVQT